MWSLAPASGTLTFSQNYQGLVEVRLSAATLTALSTTGTALVANQNTVVSADGSTLVSAFTVNALSGQTLILSATAVTLSSTVLRAGAYATVLG